MEIKEKIKLIQFAIKNNWIKFAVKLCDTVLEEIGERYSSYFDYECHKQYLKSLKIRLQILGK